MSLFRSVLVLSISLIVLDGCAGPVLHWIVQTRVHQGDIAMKRHNLHDAVLAYRLALRVDPKDPRARAGFVAASADIANVLYEKGDFEDAIVAISAAAKYAPRNVRLQALRTRIAEAKLKREIVVSNYPTYSAAGTELRKSYLALTTDDKLILASLKRFAYTYDTRDLTTAIKRSYVLELDVAKNTNRLIAYRQLVESGVPVKGVSPGTGTGASLLPLP